VIQKHLLDEGSARANRGKNAGVTVQEQGKMARTTVARLGGFTFLFYISASIVGTNLFARITKGDGIAAKLANIAAHRPQMGLCFILTLLTIFAALILAVALYALTRDEDAGLALLSVAPQASTATGSEAAASNALGSSLLRLQGWSVIVSAPVFGVGSALYYYVLARARSVPGLLAYFGVLSSVLLVIAIPLEPLQIVRARWPSIYGCLRLSSN